MKHDAVSMKQMSRMWWVAVAMLLATALCPLQALAQVPARFYWKSLSGANAIPLIVNSITGNTNPFDPSHEVTPGASFDGTLVLAGYGRTFTFQDRAAMVAVMVPMGRLSGEADLGLASAKQSVTGFGDPMLEFDINILGPKAQKNIPDALRYEPGFSMDLLADLALPIGEYDSSRPLNLGQNRWYGRVGAPIVWQLGEWVPGRRTTLEFLPAVWLFGDNSDYLGQTKKTDPMYQIDAHLSRDFTTSMWGSLDAAWYTGGKATINGVSGAALNNIGVGFTLGYTITRNINLTIGYKSTINDGAPGDLQMDGFMISLVNGWHPMVEGMERIKGE
jgi:hypothetical protein